MAAKKLSRDQKRKQKKQKRAQQTKERANSALYAPLLQHFQEAGFDDHKVVYDPPGQDKMSEVMWQFMAPYKQEADSFDAMRKLVTIAIAAWNTALLPEAKQAEALQKVAQVAPAPVIEDLTGLIQELIERKKKYFAGNQRYILDYQLTESADGYHLAVISTVGSANTGNNRDPNPTNS